MISSRCITAFSLPFLPGNERSSLLLFLFYFDFEADRQPTISSNCHPTSWMGFFHFHLINIFKTNPQADQRYPIITHPLLGSFYSLLLLLFQNKSVQAHQRYPIILIKREFKHLKKAGLIKSPFQIMTLIEAGR